MYGRDITPNHHALAEKYVLLDNFYATGAISFDGHQWLEQGFVSDNVERALTSHPRGYAWNLADALDVSPAGFIWQHAARPLEVRVGGVLSLPTEVDPATQTTRDISEDDLHPWEYYWRLYQQGKWAGAVGSRAAVPALASVIDPRYPVNAMKVTDQIRASVLEQELHEAEKSGRLPDLMVLGMTSDHTMGTTPGAPTPSAMVADNDLALGRIVEAISRSSFWASSLILVVEDDAQNGVDHVDGHRTVALAIGPSIRRGVVDSNFYTQLSMARTMQDILHIEPQTHFLKAARAMNSVFTGGQGFEPLHGAHTEDSPRHHEPGFARARRQAAGCSAKVRGDELEPCRRRAHAAAEPDPVVGQPRLRQDDSRLRVFAPRIVAAHTVLTTDHGPGKGQSISVQ